MDKTISALFDDTYLDCPAIRCSMTFYALLPAKRLREAWSDPRASLEERNIRLRLLGCIDALQSVTVGLGNDDPFYVLLIGSRINPANTVVTLPTPAVIDNLIADIPDDPFYHDQDEVPFLRAFKQAIIQHPLN